MSSRQLWLLSCGSTVAESLDSEREASRLPEPVDPAPDPETLAALRETHEQVDAAVAGLTESDRLLVRLRYQEGLTLQQVAALVGLKDAQTTDRRIREIVDKVRARLGVTLPVRGKANAASV